MLHLRVNVIIRKIVYECNVVSSAQLVTEPVGATKNATTPKLPHFPIHNHSFDKNVLPLFFENNLKAAMCIKTNYATAQQGQILQQVLFIYNFQLREFRFVLRR